MFGANCGHVCFVEAMSGVGKRYNVNDHLLNAEILTFVKTLSTPELQTGLMLKPQPGRSPKSQARTRPEADVYF